MLILYVQNVYLNWCLNIYIDENVKEIEFNLRIK